MLAKIDIIHPNKGSFKTPADAGINIHMREIGSEHNEKKWCCNC